MAKSLPVTRARITNARRLAVLAAFAVALLLIALGGVSLPGTVALVFLGWFVATGVYALALRIRLSDAQANSIQAVAYAGDITFLTAIFIALGGAWWLGGTIHGFILTVAFTSLPRRFARWVAAYAIVAFLALVGTVYSGALPFTPELGAASLAGNDALALTAALVGGVALASLALIQDTFVHTMRLAHERYRQVVHSAPDAIVATDLAGSVISANDAAAAFVGVPREKLIGRGLNDALRDSAGADVTEHFRAAARGENRDFELGLPGIGDGEARHYECSCTPIQEDDERTGVLLIARDVTQSRRDAEALRESEEQIRRVQKIEAIGQLAGGVAHDFNNLLSIILVHCEFLRSTVAHDPQRQAELRAIEGAAESAASLTRQLLAFGRKQMTQPRPLDLGDTVKSLEELLRRTLGSNIEIVTRFSPDRTPIVADPLQIEQMVLNLAVNARDAMAAGGTLTISTDLVTLEDSYRRTHAGVDPGRYAMLSVADTGSGMDPVTQEHIFEPFFTTKPEGKGTGLGLASVFGIVRQANGHIWVYSEPDQGTVFKIYFPLSEVMTRALRPTPARGVQRLDGVETILLVDDAEELRPILRRSLVNFGYTVLDARSGAEAIEVSRTYPGSIDLLITDVVMPGITGRALANELRAERPGMKVIFMSGYADTAALAADTLGVDAAFLPKPFAPDALAREVRATLDS